MSKFVLSMLGFAAMLAGCGGSGAGGTAAPAPVPAVPAAPVAQDPVESSPLEQPDGEALAETGDDTDPAAGGDFAFSGYDAPAGATGHSAAADSDATAGMPPLTAGAQHNLYVSPKGSDKASGSASQPFRSIARAARAARPGTKVHVAPGTYSGGFRTSADGTAKARIVYVSTSRWGARIVPPRNSPNKTAWDNRGSYVDIVGFEIDGSTHQGGKRWTQGIYNGGSYDSIRRNHVHHIAQSGKCERAGGAAIGVDSYYGGVKADVIANLVHDIGPAGCRFVQGIYVSTSGRVKNNVVYRVAEGGIHLWHDAANVIITNNTVTDSNTGIIVGGGDFYHSSAGNDHTAVYSNIVYDNKMGISEQGKTGPNNSYRNNLVYRNSRYDFSLKNRLKHTGTVSAPPAFVSDTRSGTPNLRPSAWSPAVGKATAAHAESTDFEGKPRNARAGYDIGAYQH